MEGGYLMERIDAKVLGVEAEFRETLVSDSVLVDGVEKFFVLESWNFIFIKGLNESLFDEDGGFFD